MESVKQSSPPERGWFKRNWKRLIGGLLLLLIVAAVGGYLAKFGPILFSQPYREALDFVTRYPQVIDALGEPIKRRDFQDWTPHGAVTGDDDNGEANLSFSVSGPKGKATVGVAARKVKGDKEWGYPTFQVTLPGDKQLNLVDAMNKTKPDETPKANTGVVKPATTTEASKDQDIIIDVGPPDQDKGKK
jgi:hypothetical protein